MVVINPDILGLILFKRKNCIPLNQFINKHFNRTFLTLYDNDNFIQLSINE